MNHIVRLDWTNHVSDLSKNRKREIIEFVQHHILKLQQHAVYELLDIL